MMLLHLVKKDILILKNAWIVLLLSIALPIFIAWRLPQYGGIGAYMVCLFFSELIPMQFLMQKEQHFKQASALLCCAPYSRAMLVASKYVFYLLVFVYTFVVYTVEALLIPALPLLPLPLLFGVVFFMTVFFGMMLPLQFWLGVEKTTILYFVLIVTTPMWIPALARRVQDVPVTALFSLPSWVIAVGFLLLAAVVWAGSLMLSISIYRRKDLV